MKSAQTWIEEHRKVGPREVTENDIKAIQLDAWKQGMEDAKAIVVNLQITEEEVVLCALGAKIVKSI